MGIGIPIPVIGTTVPNPGDMIMATMDTTTITMAIIGQADRAIGGIPIIMVGTDTRTKPPQPLTLDRPRKIVGRFFLFDI